MEENKYEFKILYDLLCNVSANNSMARKIIYIKKILN